MIRSESVLKLTAALRKAKTSFGPLLKNQENPGFKRGNKVSKYADLGAVIEATESHLEENGLLLMQFPVSEETRVGVRTLLVHESGEFLQDEFYLSLGKLDAQAGAGAVTYARRVAQKAIFGLTDEDDDGNTASRREEEPKAAPATKTAAPAAAKSSAKSAEVKAAVPKSEIPNSLPGSAQPSTSASQESSSSTDSNDSRVLPNEAEMKGFRRQFIELQESLGKAGVVPTKGNPLQKQALAYLLKTTGAARPEDITKNQWKLFFTMTDMLLSATDTSKILVEQVNSANVKTEKK